MPDCDQSKLLSNVWFSNIDLICVGTIEEMHLSVRTEMPVVVRAMARPDSGLEVRDRMWLKITIPNAFIGEFCPFE
jgi:hypothetical protein